jgi:hypothetical protein
MQTQTERAHLIRAQKRDIIRLEAQIKKTGLTAEERKRLDNMRAKAVQRLCLLEMSR